MYIYVYVPNRSVRLSVGPFDLYLNIFKIEMIAMVLVDFV